MPITEQVVELVHGRTTVHEMGGRLLGRPRKPEGA
jgi:hypothetical protein